MYVTRGSGLLCHRDFNYYLLSERKYEITVTFTGIPWSDDYQDGVNRSAVDMLINGPLQADNAGIRKEVCSMN